MEKIIRITGECDKSSMFGPQMDGSYVSQH